MSNSLASVHPELIPEWSERNLPLTPDKITFGSNKRVWWKGACGHEWETTVTDTQIENLQDKIYNGKATRADITRVTKRLGDDIAGVYGFPIPKQRQTNEQAR